MSFYNTIAQEGVAEYKDRGSKFIAYSFPFEEVSQLKMHIQKLRKAHPKAVHFCFAYRVGVSGNIFRSSDDGEPAGSAGKPILGQIDSKEVTDVLIIVVRYFGGTLLGVPGLINAYKITSAMALQVVPIIKKRILKKYIIQLNYMQINNILIIVKHCDGLVLSQENQLFTSITFALPEERVEEMLYKIKNFQNVEIAALL